MIGGVIFDLDGTLTRPVLDFMAIRAELGFPEGPPHVLERMEWLSGAERDRAWAVLCRHEERACALAELNAGGRELFAYLGAEKIPHGVLTRNASATARRTLERLGLAPDPVVSRDSDLPLKPSPEPVRFIARRWGLPPAQVLMVGDYRDDITAGREAGAVTAYLTNGRPLPEGVAPDHAISQLDELIAVLRADRGSGE